MFYWVVGPKMTVIIIELIKLKVILKFISRLRLGFYKDLISYLNWSMAYAAKKHITV